jgi:hypothetical protein
VSIPESTQLMIGIYMTRLFVHRSETSRVAIGV